MNQKYAVITGASRGIGRATAIKFASQYVNLALCCYHNTDSLSELADMLIKKYGIRVLTCQTDVGSTSSVRAFGDRVRKAFPHIDYLVNNAGISYVGLITDMTDEEWNRMMAVNLSSLFYMAKAFVPSMIHEKSGSIVNVSSMWGSAGASCEVAYSATKGGVSLFTKALAKELAPSGIRVNAVAPGCVDTEMNSGFSEDEKRALADEIPVGRFAAPEEIAESIWSISNLPYVTGQVLGVDGAFL